MFSDLKYVHLLTLPKKARERKNPGLVVFLGLRNSLFQIIEFGPDFFGHTGSELG